MSAHFPPPVITGHFINEDLNHTHLFEPDNISTWFVTVATHRKPYDYDEFDIYRGSLEDIIRYLFEPTSERYLEFFFRAERLDNDPHGFIYLLDRTNDTLRITSVNYVFVGELGTKNGRLDAHILLEVRHNGSFLRFDHQRFATKIQERFLLENETFAAYQEIYYQHKPGKEHLPLQWPIRGVPYVSFRLIGNIQYASTLRYMNKQYEERNGRIAPTNAEEEAIFNRMRIDLVENSELLVAGTARARGL